MSPLAIFSLYRSGTIKLSTWFALCDLDHSISSSNIYPGLSHCVEAVNPVSLNNANAKCKASPKPPVTAKCADENKSTAGHLVWYQTLWAESVARQEATRDLAFKIKIRPRTYANAAPTARNHDLAASRYGTFFFSLSMSGNKKRVRVLGMTCWLTGLAITAAQL